MAVARIVHTACAHERCFRGFLLFLGVQRSQSEGDETGQQRDIAANDRKFLVCADKYTSGVCSKSRSEFGNCPPATSAGGGGHLPAQGLDPDIFQGKWHVNGPFTCPG